MLFLMASKIDNYLYSLFFFAFCSWSTVGLPKMQPCWGRLERTKTRSWLEPSHQQTELKPGLDRGWGDSEIVRAQGQIPALLLSRVGRVWKPRRLGRQSSEAPDSHQAAEDGSSDNIADGRGSVAAVENLSGKNRSSSDRFRKIVLFEVLLLLDKKYSSSKFRF